MYALREETLSGLVSPIVNTNLTQLCSNHCYKLIVGY